MRVSQSLAYHAACTIHCLAIMYGHIRITVIIIEDSSYGKQLNACLSIGCVCIWSQLMQQTYIFCSLWLDIVKAFPGRYSASKRLAAATCKFLFPTCVVSINTIVTLSFWCLYCWAPHLIEDQGIMERYLEPWMNHCLHTNIIIISLLEVIICAPPFPSRKRAFITIVGMILAYTMTVTGCHLGGGPWAYPIIEIMFTDWFLFIIYLILTISIGFGGYLVAEYVNYLFHGRRKITATTNGYDQDYVKKHIQ